MADNVTLTDVTNLTNSSAVSQINSSFTTIEEEFDKVLYKDGREELTSNLDANGKRILNSPAPVNPTDLVRLQDIDAAVVSALAYGGQWYLSLALGEAATVAGQKFAVVSGGLLDVYLRTAGVSTLLFSGLTKAALDAYAATVAAPTGGGLVGLTSGTVDKALPTQERFAEQGGTVAGEVDSKATLHTALKAMRTLGGGRLKLLPGKTYNTSLSGATDMGGLVTTYPNLGNLLIPPVDNLHFDGNGGYLRSTAPSGALLVAMADYEREDIVTGAMAVGATTWTFLTAGVATNYAVGNNVLWRLEDNPIDTPEPLNWGHAKVLSVNTGANTVTLDRPLHRAWDGTDTNNKKLYRLATSHGQVIDNVRVAGLAVNGSTEVIGMLLHSLVAPRIPNTFVRDARIGVSVQMVEGADFGQVVLEHAPYTTSNTGQGIRCAESSVHIDSLYTRGVESEAVIAETASHVTIDYHEDVAINPKASRIIVQVGTNCEVHIRRALYKGKGGCMAFNSIDGGRISWGHAHYEKDSHESSYPLPGRDCQELSLNIAGVKELYRAADKVNLTPLIEGGNTGAALEYFRPGLVSRLVVFFGGGLVAADITSLNLSYLDGTQQLITITPPAVSTQNAVDLTASLPRPGTAIAPNAFANRASYLNVSVNWASDLRGTGKFLLFDIDIIPDALDTSYLFGDVTSLRKAHGPNIRIGQKTYDAPSIAAGAQTSTTVIVTGAAVGDFVTAVALGVSPAGLTISGHVTAADTVTVWLDNNTAGAIDLASTTLSVKIEKR